jgi:ketosteroid isomerase-like protein
MSEHPNAALHRKAHEAFSRGDMDTLTEMTAEDTVWHSPGKSLISGEFRGREAVFGDFFAKMDELSGGTAKFEKHQDYLGNDEHSVALFQFSATRNGKTLEGRVCEEIRWRSGQIVEEWTYLDDQYGWDAFWS